MAPSPLGRGGEVELKMDAGDDVVDFYPSTMDVVARIHGGTGNDQLLGGDGTDYLYGETGDDYLAGYGGQDWLVGGTGADQFSGGDGGGGDMVSYADHHADVTASLDGATGNDGALGEGDTIGTDVEMLEGGAGNDKLTGDDGDNVLQGCGGDDHLYGLGGDDALYGDNDGEYGEDGHDNDRWNDCRNAAPGADVFSGGAGSDMVGYQLHPGAVTADLDGVIGDDGMAGEHDTIGADVENLDGGYGADTLFGNAGPNTLEGEGGDDIIQGLAGDDLIDGNDGNDRLSGGAGLDWIAGGDGVGTETCETVHP